MADLVFAPIADQIKDATYSCYDGMRHGRYADGGAGSVEQDCCGERQEGIHPSVRTGNPARNLRHRQGRHDAKGRRRGGHAHRLRLHAVQRSACGAFVRLYAGESSLRQELEDRRGAHGQRQEEGNPRHPLQRCHRRWRAAFDDSPFLRWSAAVPAQQHQQDETGYAAGQPALSRCTTAPACLRAMQAAARAMPAAI